MAHLELEAELFPDDERDPPAAGSREQQQLIAFEESLADETYDDDLNLFLDVPMLEVMKSCVETALTLLRLGDGEARPLKVLDLGTGRGSTALGLMRMAKVSEVTLHDLSDQLLEKAEKAVARQFPEVSVHRAQVDMSTHNLSDSLPHDHFDLVVTTNFMQHIAVARQAEIYRDVYRLLRRGGVYANVAHVKMLTPDWRQGVVRQLEKWWHEAKCDPALFEPKVGRHFLETHVHTTLPQIFDAYKETGFRFYDCPYRRFIYAVVVAMK